MKKVRFVQIFSRFLNFVVVRLSSKKKTVKFVCAMNRHIVQFTSKHFELTFLFFAEKHEMKSDHMFEF